MEKKKELSNTKGLHFVSKRIYLKKKLGIPLILLLESEQHTRIKLSSKFEKNSLKQIHSHPHN